MMGAGSDDRKGLRNDGLCYMLKNPKDDVLDPPIPKAAGKSIRGFSHKTTARFLCPQSILASFDTDPS